MSIDDLDKREHKAFFNLLGYFNKKEPGYVKEFIASYLSILEQNAAFWRERASERITNER